MRGVYIYREGYGAYRGKGLYVTNEPGLGFIVALYLFPVRLCFRYIWHGYPTTYWGRWYSWRRIVLSARRWA